MKIWKESGKTTLIGEISNFDSTGDEVGKFCIFLGKFCYITLSLSLSKALFATCLTLGSLSAKASFLTYSKQCLALIAAADSQADALTIGEESRSKGINAMPDRVHNYFVESWPFD